MAPRAYHREVEIPMLPAPLRFALRFGFIAPPNACLLYGHETRPGKPCTGTRTRNSVLCRSCAAALRPAIAPRCIQCGAPLRNEIAQLRRRCCECWWKLSREQRRRWTLKRKRLIEWATS